MKFRFYTACLAIALSACKPASNEATVDMTPAALPKSGKPQVLVANYPLQYFAQRIAGEYLKG